MRSGCMRRSDPAAAQDTRIGGPVSVEHAGLARSHSIFSLMQQHGHSPVLREKCGRLRLLAGANAHVEANSPFLHVLARAVAEPVHVFKHDQPGVQDAARTDDDLVPVRIQANNVQRIASRKLQTPALADGEIEDAAVPAEHAAIDMDDVASLGSVRPQALHDVGIAACGNKADILAVGLFCNRQSKLTGESTNVGLLQMTQGEPQEAELLAGRGKEKVALVALGIGGAVKLGAVRAGPHEIGRAHV